MCISVYMNVYLYTDTLMCKIQVNAKSSYDKRIA